MIRFNKLLTFFFLFIYFTQNSYASEQIAFVNLDKILKNSNLGKSLIKDIQNQNDKNINELTNNEIDLKNSENDLDKIKNIISKEEYENKLNELREKINNYRNKKNQMVKKIEQDRNLKLENFFLKINPIIQDYMNKNSIDILLEQKNIFIGKSSSDITNILIDEINKKFN